MRRVQVRDRRGGGFVTETGSGPGQERRRVCDLRRVQVWDRRGGGFVTETGSGPGQERQRARDRRRELSVMLNGRLSGGSLTGCCELSSVRGVKVGAVVGSQI